MAAILRKVICAYKNFVFNHLNAINRVKCFFLGHEYYVDKYSNQYYCKGKRKGGSKRRYIRWHKTKHITVRCLRCGKILNHK